MYFIFLSYISKVLCFFLITIWEITCRIDIKQFYLISPFSKVFIARTNIQMCAAFIEYLEVIRMSPFYI